MEDRRRRKIYMRQVSTEVIYLRIGVVLGSTLSPITSRY
jgi:hypothetical protein